MADPRSWYVVEKGWKVLAADGSDVGTVDEVLGDETADIFDGLAVAKGLGSAPVYVPSESVDEIVEGAVKLSLAGARWTASPRTSRAARRALRCPSRPDRRFEGRHIGKVSATWPR